MGNDFCNNAQLDQDNMYRSRDTTNSTYGSGSHYSYSLVKRPSSIINQKPVGLENLTNTCYISAILQILFLILPESLNQRKGRITQLFFRLKATKDTKDYKIFKSEVEKVIQIVQGYQQQDAQEFLIHFLDILDRQNTELAQRYKVNLDYNERLGIPQNYKIYLNQMAKLQKSPIVNLFAADMLKVFACQKGKNHYKHKFQRYQCLSLSFPTPTSNSNFSYYSSQSEVSLTDLLRKQIAQESISDLACEQCKQKTDFKKQTFFYTVPNYLIIHLARFKQGYHSNQKINTIVEYEDNLTIRPSSTKTNIRYRLIGTVNHFGTLNRGHYFAEIKHADGNWYEINDEVVRSTRVEATGNKSKYVYILFFQRLK